MSIYAKRSGILYVFESKYCVPNGDPFTNLQRIDEATKRILISDVRIKRYIRDHILRLNKLYPEDPHHIYLREISPQEIEDSKVDKKATASAAQVKLLQNLFSGDESLKVKGKKGADVFDVEKLLLKCIDVRLFGGVATEKDNNVNTTGPVQFSVLSQSLHAVDLRMHQNTTVFQSAVDKKQGSIGTTAIVPYSCNQITGWVDSTTALVSGLLEEDVLFSLRCLWDAVNVINTRSKQGQYSLAMLKINYSNPFYKTSILDDLISINTPIQEEDIRSRKDYTFNLDRLIEHLSKDVVESVDCRISEELDGYFLKALLATGKINQI
jgi:CRISPR-associated protein Csh2